MTQSYQSLMLFVIHQPKAKTTIAQTSLIVSGLQLMVQKLGKLIPVSQWGQLRGGLR